jgi:hypothetical protein
MSPSFSSSKLTASGGSNDGEQYPIENARIDGNKPTFDLTTGDWKFTYRLKSHLAQLEGDQSGREWSCLSRQSRAPGSFESLRQACGSVEKWR